MTIRSLAAVLAASTALIAAAPAQAQQVDRIVAFGDSYVDDGNLFQILGFNPAPQVYPTGRFSGGTNYVDTLSQILNVPVENFGIGGALTGNTNTNAPGLPGFAFEYTSFLNGGGGVFPTVSPTFDENDLLVVSIGGNDARFYEQNDGTLAGAPAAAGVAVAQATAGLNALVGAGAPTVSFLAGNTAILPEIATDPAAQAIRNSFSNTFNAGIQPVLAGYAANGTIVHYLDLTVVGQQITANPTAYGLTSAGACAPAPQCVTNPAYANQFLFYVDALHLTSAGFAIVGQYVAAQLQAPLTFQATAELGQDTARQFARTLNSRMDLGDASATGIKLFFVGDAFSRKVDESQRSDAFDVEGAGATAGVSFGLGNATVGVAANISRPRARFAVDIGQVKATSYQVGGFAGLSPGAIVAQGYVGYGKDDLRTRRGGVVERVTGSANGNHWLAGAKAGFLAPMGGLRAGPVAALDYTRASVDDYSESGDPALDLNVGRMSARSLTGGIGGELRGDLTSGGLRLRPFASAMLEKLLDGDGRTVRFSQMSAPTIVNSWTLGDRSKKAYGRVSAGGSADLSSGASINAVISSTVSRKDEDELSAHVGLSLGF